MTSVVSNSSDESEADTLQIIASASSFSFIYVHAQEAHIDSLSIQKN